MNYEGTHLFKRLLLDLPFSTAELNELIYTAPFRYKDHYIEKRNGRGKRLISQPTKEVKYLQRYLLTHILGNLPIHSAATAYRRNLSIKDHALPHAGARYLLKIDFQDFFPSITSESLAGRLKNDLTLNDLEIDLILKVLCRYDTHTTTLRLSIGSPSSPYISNYFLFDFDTLVSEFCEANDVFYTRYADDLAFSSNTPKALDKIHAYIESTLKRPENINININHNKTVNVSKKNRRTLVGLTLSNAGTVSLGRNAKRDLRNQLYRASKGGISQADMQKLKGQLAFLFSVDPEFVRSLCQKYAVEKVSELPF